MDRQLLQDQIQVTKHASHRMSTRSIREWQVEQVLAYGRRCHNRKAIIYAVGRNEIRQNGRFLEPCAGIHVICSSQEGNIITVYRNNKLSGLRR